MSRNNPACKCFYFPESYSCVNCGECLAEPQSMMGCSRGVGDVYHRRLTQANDKRILRLTPNALSKLSKENRDSYKATPKISPLERQALEDMRLLGIPEPRLEQLFHADRKWRFDFSWVEPIKVCLMVEGGTWNKGAHARGKSIDDDLECSNEATLAGWTVIRATSSMLRQPVVLNQVKQMLQKRKREEMGKAKHQEYLQYP